MGLALVQLEAAPASCCPHGTLAFGHLAVLPLPSQCAASCCPVAASWLPPPPAVAALLPPLHHVLHTYSRHLALRLPANPSSLPRGSAAPLCHAPTPSSQSSAFPLPLALHPLQVDVAGVDTAKFDDAYFKSAEKKAKKQVRREGSEVGKGGLGVEWVDGLVSVAR